MFVLIIGVILLLASIASIVFYQLMAQAASAVIVLSCRMDHGHFSNHWMPCHCKCHLLPQLTKVVPESGPEGIDVGVELRRPPSA